MTTATTVVPVPVRKHGRLRTPLAVGLPLLALAGASVGVAVALADDDAAPVRAATRPAIAIAQSPDAAERWLTAESPTIQSGSPDALERRLTPPSSQAGTERGREADAARLQAQADAYLAAQLEP